MYRGGVNLDLNLLRTFLLILDHGSVTAAADELRLTQPTVSHSLRRLRDALGDPLFVRRGTRLVPTARALELEPVVRTSLGALDGALDADARFTPATTTRRFRIAQSDVGEQLFLGRIVGALTAQAPSSSLTAMPMEIDEVTDWLRRGEVDAAIATVPLEVSGRSRIVDDDRYVALVPSDWGSVSGPLTLDDLRSRPQAVITREAGHDLLTRTLHSLGLDTEAMVRVRHFSIMPMLVREAGLIGFVPAYMAVGIPSEHGLRVAELPPATPRFDVNLYWNEEATGRVGPRRWFVDLVKSALAESRAPGPFS